MKTAFVTGATGFLGINLVEQLVNQGWEVIAFHLPGDHPGYLEKFDVEYRSGDLLDYQSLLNAIPADGDVVVFHVAGDTSMWKKNDERQTQINVTGTENICKAALENRVKRLVYTSSSSAYGYHCDKLTEHTESNALSCGMNYNRTKYLAEQEIHKAIQLGLDAVILNPCNIIGPYDSTGWSRLIGSMVENKAPGVTLGVGTFAHVRNVANAHIRAAEVGRTGENYLLGGFEATFKEVFEEINRILGKSVPLKVLSPGLLRFAMYLMRVKSYFDGLEPLLTYPIYKRLTGNLTCDDSKARQELGFSTPSIHEMLLDSYNWLIKEKILDAGDQ